MNEDVVERPSDDALAVLALCEAAGDDAAADSVRVIIEDFALTAAAKASFFSDLRKYFDSPISRGKRPLSVMVDFVKGPGRQYLMLGEPVPGLTVNLEDPEQYVQGLLALALRDRVSRVLFAPAEAILFRGAEKYLIAPLPDAMYPLVFDYCRGMVGMAEGVNDISCTVARDGSLLPGSAEGVHGRVQVVTDGRVYAVQVLLPVP